LGLILGKIFSELLKLKDNDIKSIVAVNQVFMEELGFGTAQLCTINDDKWIDILKNEMNFDNVNMDKLADILLFTADNNITGENNQVYQKCLIIYQYLEKTEKTYSFERNLKIKKITGQKQVI
jgi:hypothetical protein